MPEAPSDGVRPVNEHRILIEDSDYPDEMYIRCFCYHATSTNGTVPFTGRTVEELVAFLREHGALGERGQEAPGE